MPRSLCLLSRAFARDIRQDEEEGNENGCTCDCTACAKGDDCEDCSNVARDDADCHDAGCPNQDQTPEKNFHGKDAPDLHSLRLIIPVDEELELLRMRARLAAVS
jgi:hypothetical protein